VDRKTERLYEEGIALFDRAQFFEAHEVWEDAWRPARGDDRALLHGVIQVAAGLHKLQCGKPAGAASLLAKGIGRLSALRGAADRPGLGPFVETADAWRRAIERGADAESILRGEIALPRLVPRRDRRFTARLMTDVTIEAAADRVWGVLIDFDAYPGWNSFLPSIRGEARTGTLLAITVLLRGRHPMSLRTRVLRVVPRRELRWRGRLLLPGLFDGEHVFTIAPLSAGRVRFSQRETFRGALVPVLGRALFGTTLRGFEEMNRALKTRAEGPESPDLTASGAT
jgi:hypothetical protein